MKQDAITPQHYKAGKVECIEALESATIGKQGIEAVCVANVIKYLWRYEAKGGVQDCKKAKWYLERLIYYLETKEKSKDSSGGVKKTKQTAGGRIFDEKAGLRRLLRGDKTGASIAQAKGKLPALSQKANAKN